MDIITHEARLDNWKHIVEECSKRPQGVTVKQWVADNGINEKVYYYWLRRVRQAAYDQMRLEQSGELAVTSDRRVSYAEITLTGNTSSGQSMHPVAVLSAGNISIDISEQASEEFLIKLMRAMKNAG